MRLLLLAAFTPAVVGQAAEAKACGDCTIDGALEYQKCAMEHGGDPCVKLNDGLVTLDKAGGVDKKATGKAINMDCCMTFKKHEQCMDCRGLDCGHDTCKINKNYYREYDYVKDAKKTDADKAANQEAIRNTMGGNR